MEGKTLVKNWGNLRLKLRKIALNFDSKFGGIEAIGPYGS